MKLKAYIKKVGAQRFADQTGLSVNTVYAYACGAREPGAATAKMIQRATKNRVKIQDCYEPEVRQ